MKSSRILLLVRDHENTNTSWIARQFHLLLQYICDVATTCGIKITPKKNKFSYHTTLKKNVILIDIKLDRLHDLRHVLTWSHFDDKKWNFNRVRLVFQMIFCDLETCSLFLCTFSFHCKVLFVTRWKYWKTDETSIECTINESEVTNITTNHIEYTSRDIHLQSQGYRIDVKRTSIHWFVYE